MKNISMGQKIFGVVERIISLIAVFVILFPIVWLVRSSVVPTVLIYEKTPPLFFTPTFSAYQRAFVSQHLDSRTINSLLISVVSTVIAVLAGAMASYGITRFSGRFGKNLPFVFLFMRMIPAIAMMLPLFLMFTSYKLIDTYSGMILSYAAFGIPTIIWMMWGYFRDLPHEIEESAYIDGSGHINTFIRIVLPITTPALASVAILSFTTSWNEYMMASILTRTKVTTLPLAVVSLMSQTELAWDIISAGGVVLSLPVIILCLVAQKYFVKGLTAGAVKG